VSTDPTQGDPLVPHHDNAPGGDHPVAAPEDQERPQGDPLRAAPAPEAETPGAGGADTPPVTPEPDPIAQAEARAAEYLDMARRKQAEFENFRKRMAQQVGQAEERGIAKLAKELLPALDHLERALEAAEEHGGGEQWVRGIRLVQEEMTGALGRAGIQAFAPVGDAFDPNEHEAMAQAPIEGAESGTVAQVYQAGYRLNGTVLRPARVVVAQ
jgi:molecular chaperone GrpE